MTERLAKAIERFNPIMLGSVLSVALSKLKQVDYASLIEENRSLHHLLVEGVPIDVRGENGVITGEYARLIGFEYLENSVRLTVSHFLVIDNRVNSRSDVLVFVNGLSLVVIKNEECGQRMLKT